MHDKTKLYKAQQQSSKLPYMKAETEEHEHRRHKKIKMLKALRTQQNEQNNRTMTKVLG